MRESISHTVPKKHFYCLPLQLNIVICLFSSILISFWSVGHYQVACGVDTKKSHFFYIPTSLCSFAMKSGQLLKLVLTAFVYVGFSVSFSSSSPHGCLSLPNAFTFACHWCGQKRVWVWFFVSVSVCVCMCACVCVCVRVCRQMNGTVVHEDRGRMEIRQQLGSNRRKRT